MPLSHAMCIKAKPSIKPYKLTDEGGLYLHIMPNGQRYWRCKYRIHEKERTIALGRFPEISLLDARIKKDQIAKDIINGVDPLVKKTQLKQTADYNAAQTFRLIACEWHQRNYDSWAKRHADCIMYRMDKYLFHRIGSMPITTITPQILLATLQKVENTSPDIARRVVQYCRRICEYAVVTGRLDRDLTFGLPGVMKKPKRGHVASIDIDELPDLLKAIEADREKSYPQTNLAIRLMLLTFVRTKELIQAKWEEIDFDRKMWTVPAERMKMRKPHLVPLSKQALEIMNELKELNGHREYIFPSIPYPKKPMSNNTILHALERMGYKGRMTGHGFRSLSMGIIKERLGYRHEVIDRQLAHVPKNEVDRAYDRAYFLTDRQNMMDEYGTYLDNLCQSDE